MSDIRKLIHENGGVLEFVALTGIKQRTVYDYQNGKYEPTEQQYKLIRDAIKWRKRGRKS